MNDLRLLTKQNHLTLLITKESTSLESDFNIFQNFTLFLIKYAFVLTDSIQDTNSSKPQFLPPGELFSQNPNGARYLDPKYSRWISTDPALGEYVPQAPINDEAKKHNQNLPGMGGLFNTVNLSLYHYAGNNPIKYVDPDGRSNEDDFISCFKTNLKNNNDITKALLVTISQNKSKDFSFSQDNVKKLIKELNISLEPVAKKLLNNLDSISYRFDSASKLGKLKIKMQNETSIDLTDRMNVKIFKETEYSIKFESDKKFTLEAPKTSTPPKINIFGIKAKKIEIGFTATNKFAVFKVNGISLLKYIQ